MYAAHVTTLEAHLIGTRELVSPAPDGPLGPGAGDVLLAALHALGWARGDVGVEVEVQDRGEHGLWVRGIGPELARLPAALARVAAAPVQHYVARIDGDTITLAGATWFPGRPEPVPVTSVADGWTLVDEDRAPGPETLALGALEVAAAMREGWDLADAAIEHWTIAVR